MLYRQIVRPFLFAFDPERIHRLTLRAMRFCGGVCGWRPLVRRCCRAQDGPLTVGGLHLPGRIGLSAGFDKGAEAIDVLPDFGFAFVEVGTVTPTAAAGNPAPRIFRLLKCDSLIARTGFNNPGADIVAARLRHKAPHQVVGVNINKDAGSEGPAAVADLARLVEQLHGAADYFTLNWGSLSPTDTDAALAAIDALKCQQEARRPIFLKLPADIPEATIDEVLTMAARRHVDGVVATGPTQQRDGLKDFYSPQTLEAIGPGAVSGRAMGRRSERVVRYVRQHAPKGFVIIGAGGIMTPADARRMLTAGADLLQIYSTFIFNGPAIVRKMSKTIATTVS